MKEYWFCIVGPIERKDLPDGADMPMRFGVTDALRTMIPHGDIDIWSGWGVTDDTKRKILDVIHSSFYDKIND